MKLLSSRLRVPLATVLFMSLGFMEFADTPAHADSPSQQGWWTVTNPGQGAPTPPYPALVPDVPPDGLLVQGGDPDPSAYAALVYSFPRGAIIGTLTLNVTSGSATTNGSTLQVCPLITPNINPAQGGPIADGPRYNCSKHTTAMPKENGYQFNVVSLISDGTLAVAILPTSATDRVVFDRPDANSLAVKAGTTGGRNTSSSGRNTSSTGTVTNQDVTTAPSPGVAGMRASNGSDATAPAGATAPALRAVGVDPAPTGFLSPPSTSSDGANPVAVGAVLVGLLLAGALWVFAGRAAIRAAILAEPAARST